MAADPLTPLSVVARTIWGEARGDGVPGMHAVANVIANRVRNPRKVRWRIRQYPESGVRHPDRFRAGFALQSRCEFLGKPSGHWRGLRGNGVTEIKSADGADLRGGCQAAKKAISFQQNHRCACAPGCTGCRHTRRTATDNEHVAGNGGVPRAMRFVHGAFCLMCSP